MDMVSVKNDFDPHLNFETLVILLLNRMNRNLLSSSHVKVEALYCQFLCSVTLAKRVSKCAHCTYITSVFENGGRNKGEFT